MFSKVYRKAGLAALLVNFGQLNVLL